MRRKRDEGPGHEGSAAGGGRSTASAMITPLDIQQKEFQVSRLGGYRMREVDEFLDQLTDAMTAVLAENERLRAGASSPIVGSPDLDEVSRQADEIIQRARDEAARIVADARTRASSAPGGTSGVVTAAEREAVDAFLARERAFLQRLAALVQEHADGVKSMAKDVRRRSATGVPTPPVAPATPGDEAASAEAEASGSESSEAEDVEADGRDDVREEEASADPDATRPIARVTASDDAGDDEEEPIVVAEAEAERTRASARSRRDDDRDDTLRELFWGEEG